MALTNLFDAVAFLEKKLNENHGLIIGITACHGACSVEVMRVETPHEIVQATIAPTISDAMKNLATDWEDA